MASLMAVPTLHIDIVSDVVCPWCVIGFKRLEQALARFEGRFEAELSWQPFELNPTMPAGGQPIGEHMARKYGATLDQAGELSARLTRLGAEVGFDLHFDDDMRIYGTPDAHRLLWWAGERDRSDARERTGVQERNGSRERPDVPDPDDRPEGRGCGRHGVPVRQTDLALTLFSAYFVEKQAVDDRDVLVGAAVRAGLDGYEARGVLERGDYAEVVREAETRWVASGIRSVPTFVLDGRRLIAGAQEVDVFEEQLEQVTGG